MKSLHSPKKNNNYKNEKSSFFKKNNNYKNEKSSFFKKKHKSKNDNYIFRTEWSFLV